MTIKLPSDLEDSVRSEVMRGHFAGADDLVAEIVRDYMNVFGWLGLRSAETPAFAGFFDRAGVSADLNSSHPDA